MVYEPPSNESDLAYDLRQAYAKILGEHLIDAAEARKANDYYRWFKALEDIKTISQHKFKKKGEAVKEYKKIIDKIIILANKYPAVWSGLIQDSDSSAELEYELRSLEEFIYEKLEEAKMFGEGWKIAGL